MNGAISPIPMCLCTGTNIPLLTVVMVPRMLIIDYMELVVEELIVNTPSQEITCIAESASPYSCESLYW